MSRIEDLSQEPKGPQRPNPKMEGLSPFVVERITEVSEPLVEFKEDKIFINGVAVEGYIVPTAGFGVVKPNFQRNYPSIIKFKAKTNQDEKKEYLTRAIDVRNPGKELLSIKSLGDNRDTYVNGVKWDALVGYDIYYGEYSVEVDPEGRQIVFLGRKNQGGGVIVNNRVWNTKFESSFNMASSRFGVVYAIGDGKLVIEDKEWSYQKKEEKGTQYSKDTIEKAVVGKGERVAAVSNAVYPEINAWRSRILLGDKTGARHEWKTTLDRVTDLIIDDETGSVAVFGSIGKNESPRVAVILDDVPYEIPEAPDRLEHFKFQDGGVVIQYTDALGEKVTKKISLREDAREVQERIEKEKETEAGLAQLRRLVIEAGIPLSEIPARLKRGEDFDKMRTRADELYRRLNDVQAENRKLDSQLKDLTDEKRKEGSQHERDKENTRANLLLKLGVIEPMLKGAVKTIGGSRKLSTEQMDKILKAIQDLKK